MQSPGPTNTACYGNGTTLFIAAVDRAAWLHSPVFLLVLSLGLIVICSSYVALWIKKASLRFRFEDRLNKMRLRDKRLAKTLFITTIAFLITWLPFYFYVVHQLACTKYPPICYSYHIAFALKLLQFSNSFINCLIYSLRIGEFRATIRRLFHWRFSRTTRMTDIRIKDAGEKRSDKNNVAEDTL